MKNLIPCVGFELQYSPLQRDSVDNLASSFITHMNELSFDVIKPVEAGQEILVLFSNKQIPTQQITADVINCIYLSDGHYRISLRTRPDSVVSIDKAELISLPINKGPSTAQELVLSCPACKISTPFIYIAIQEGDWEQGILPIYNCGSCGTTRAMIGLFTSNKNK